MTSRAGALESETREGGPLDGVAVTWSYDSLRRRDGLTATYGQTSLASTGYTYGSASRLATVTSGGNTVTYAYQANSNLVNTLTFNNGTANVLTTTKTNDALNRLTGISSVPASASTVSYAYLYNTANQRIRATLADGSYWVYQYDSLGQVTSGQKYWQDDTAVGGMQFGYAFDDIGNRTSATTNGRQADYTANLLNEYTEATVPGAVDVLGTANPAATLTINRAAVPNRTGSYYWKTLNVTNTSAPVWQEVKVVGVRKNAGPDDKDVVTESIGHEFVPQTPEAFTYDDDGNLTSDGRWAYTWDGENRLVKMEAASGLPAGARKKIEFAYDGQSRRVEKKSYTWSGSAWVLASDLVFVYDGWNLIAELKSSDLSLVRKYCWGLDLSGSLQGAGGVGGLLAVTSGSATQFTAYDGNGNIVALIDAATGAEVAHYEYDPFGNTLVQTGAAAAANPFRFSTKYTDDETGLLYYGLRYYSPRLGRWISRDSIEERGGDNLYSFVLQSPVNKVDWLGQWGSDVHNSKTVLWALAVGYSPNSYLIGYYDDGVDGSTSGPTGWMPSSAPGNLAGDQRYHFNVGRASPDTRHERRDYHLAQARHFCAKAVDDKDFAVLHLGIALHPLQDWWAHGDHESGWLAHNAYGPTLPGWATIFPSPHSYPDREDLDADQGPQGRAAGPGIFEHWSIPGHFVARYKSGTQRIANTERDTKDALSAFLSYVKSPAAGCQCKAFFLPSVAP